MVWFGYQGVAIKSKVERKKLDNKIWELKLNDGSNPIDHS